MAASQLMGMVGEFEKPKYFSYNEKICAHGRNGQVGCSACIDVCSTKAITVLHSKMVKGRSKLILIYAWVVGLARPFAHRVRCVTTTPALLTKVNK
jgi:ferredoxin